MVDSQFAAPDARNELVAFHLRCANARAPCVNHRRNQRNIRTPRARGTGDPAAGPAIYPAGYRLSAPLRVTHSVTTPDIAMPQPKATIAIEVLCVRSTITPATCGAT